MIIRNKGKRLSGFFEDYVVFDLETTGINPERDAIIEISAIKVCGHKIVEEYTTLVNPQRPIPAGASAINGITDNMVTDAPDIKTAIAGFLAFAENKVLVGHNIHTFDMNFAYDAAWEFLGHELSNDYVDTLYMARRCLPKLPHHKLTDISEYFHIETKGAHRALADCIMNQKCYEEMGKILKNIESNEETDLQCPKCGGNLVKRKGKYGYFYGCEEFPRCRFTKNIKETEK